MIKLLVTVPAAVAMLGAIVAAQTPSAPPSATTNKIAVMNIQAALAATKDGQAALDEMDKRMLTPKRKEIEAKQVDLKELQEKLSKGANLLAQSAKDDLQRQIDQRSKNLNRDMEDAQAELEQEQGKIVNELLTKLNPILQKYLQDNAYSILFDVSDPQRSGVFWVSDAVDITKAVVELYDKTAPTTPAAKPAAAKPPASAAKPPAAPPKTPPAK